MCSQRSPPPQPLYVLTRVKKMPTQKIRRALRSERSERSKARRPTASSTQPRISSPSGSKNPVGFIPSARTVARAALGEPAFARKGRGMSGSYFGVDVSKETLDMHHWGVGGQSFANTP